MKACPLRGPVHHPTKCKWKYAWRIYDLRLIDTKSYESSTQAVLTNKCELVRPFITVSETFGSEGHQASMCLLPRRVGLIVQHFLSIFKEKQSVYVSISTD